MYINRPSSAVAVVAAAAATTAFAFQSHAFWQPGMTLAAQGGSPVGNTNLNFERRDYQSGTGQIFKNSSFSDSNNFGSSSWGGDALVFGAAGTGGNYFRARSSASASGGPSLAPKDDVTAFGDVELFRDNLRINGPGGAPRSTSVQVTFKVTSIRNVDANGQNGWFHEPEAQASNSVTIHTANENGDLAPGYSEQFNSSNRIFILNKSTDPSIRVIGDPGIVTENRTVSLTIAPDEYLPIQIFLDTSADPGVDGKWPDTSEDAGYFTSAFAESILKLWVDSIVPVAADPVAFDDRFSGYTLQSDYGIDYSVVDPVPTPGTAAGLALLGAIACRRRR